MLMQLAQGTDVTMSRCFAQPRPKKKTDSAPVRIGTNENGAEVVLAREMLERHVLFAGSTGMGKSTAMRLMIARHFRNRHEGMLVLDPHGDLVDELLEEAASLGISDRVVLFDPAGDGPVLGFSPFPRDLDGTPVSTLVGLISSAILKAWGTHDGGDSHPRISKWIEAVLTLLVVNRMSLLESTAVMSLRDDTVRQQFLANVKNEAVQEAWSLFEAAPLREKLTYLEGVSNRLARFVKDESLQLVLGQSGGSTLDLATAMRESKLVLCRLHHRGRVPEESMRLMGTLLITEAYRVALLRKRQERERKFYVYIDEAARFLTRSLAGATSETRKYGLFWALAIQNLAQLDSEDRQISESVQGNTRVKVVFGGLPIGDAKLMGEELFTGFLDPMKVKDEIRQTKVRTEEERRVVVALSEQESQQAARARGEGGSEVATDSRGVGYGTGSGTVVTDGEQVGSGTQRSRGRNLTVGQGTSEGEAETQTKGRNRVDSATLSQATGNTWTDTETETENHGQGASRSEGEAKDSILGPDRITATKSDTVQKGKAAAHADGGSQSVTAGRTRADGQSSSVAYGRTKTHQQNVTLGESVQEGESSQASKNHAVARSQNEQYQVQVGRAVAVGKNFMDTLTRSQGSSSGITVTLSPFLKPVEYQEMTSRTYVSLDEQLHEAVGRMKNLPVGSAVLKLGNEAPLLVRFDRIERPAVSADALRRFKAQVYARNGYLSRDDARAQIERRQRLQLGRVLYSIDRPIALPPAGETPAVEEAETEVDGGSDFPPTPGGGLFEE